MSETKYKAYEKLYISIREAAEWTGIGEKRIRQYVNSAYPPPCIRVGNKTLIKTETLPKYLETFLEAR